MNKLFRKTFGPKMGEVGSSRYRMRNFVICAGHVVFLG